MLKICGKSVIKPLQIIYKNVFRRVVFPTSARTQMLFKSIKKITNSQRSYEIITENYFSDTKIGENTTNILKCYLSKQIYTLAHQTKSLNIEN